MAQVKVTIKPDGTAKIYGEGLETSSLKKALEGLGLVVERHEGHVHVKDHDHTESTIEEGR